MLEKFETLTRGRDFFGQFDIYVLLVVLCAIALVVFFMTVYVLLFHVLAPTWFRIGYVLCKKKYNGGKCSKAVCKYKCEEWNGYVDCDHRYEIHRIHWESMPSYGPLLLSRKFVRKYVCEGF